MKIYKISQIENEDLNKNKFWDDEVDELSDENLKSIEDVEKLSLQFIQKAQEVYNEWNEEDIDTYAGGGICHFIAEEMSQIMWDNDIQNTTYSSDFEQHVACVALVKEGIFNVDIHHSVYETGGGFTWKKIPDVIFTPDDVSFYHISSDKEDWNNFVEN